MGAAIFAESNRARVAEKRARRLPQAALDAAAADQAVTMAAQLRPSHDGPFAGRRNAFEHVQQAGLDPELVAENVSAISLPAADSGATWPTTTGGWPRSS
ncbi:MAG: hypothetical protein H7343_01030 [Undibacterium sp.]|nr:hypothetical protein [Opitutaceae bacterium]